MKWRERIRDWASSRWYDHKLARALKRKDFLAYLRILKERWEVLAPDVVERKLAVFLRSNVIDKLALPGYEDLPIFCEVANGTFWRTFSRNFMLEFDCRFRLMCDLLNEENLRQSIVASAREAMGAVQERMCVKNIALIALWPSRRELRLQAP